MSTQIDLPIAGGTVRAAGELVRRYCGMTGETWAYPFYDAVPTSPVVGPVDLLAAGIMHGPIRQEDLEWFVQVRDGMQRLVIDARVPNCLFYRPVRARLVSGSAFAEVVVPDGSSLFFSGGGVRDRFHKPAFPPAEDPQAHPPIGTGAKGVVGCPGGLIHGEVRDV